MTRIGKQSVNYSTSQESVNKIVSALRNFEKKVQRKLIRKGLRQLGQQLALQVKSGIYWNDSKLRQKVKVKVKSYKRGTKIWLGVGFLNEPTDDWKIKVRAHAYNGGWRPYPKGRPTNRTGKGWRKGLRKLGGQKIWNTQFVNNVYKQCLPKANDMLYDNILEAIRELNVK
jgi:hypothetical protein